MNFVSLLTIVVCALFALVSNHEQQLILGPRWLIKWNIEGSSFSN